MSDWLQHDPKTRDLLLVGSKIWDFMPPNFMPDVPQVAVDGGIHMAREPILWAGDGDSGLRPTHIPNYFKEDQNETDLRFCLRGIRQWQWTHLHLVGFYGGLFDHELACFGEIYREMKARPQFTQATFYTGQLLPHILFLQSGAFEMDRVGRYAVMAFEPTALTMNGDCAYSCDNRILQPFSGGGVSNEGSGTIKIKTDKPVMVIFAN